MKKNVFYALSMGLCLVAFTLTSCDELQEVLDQENQNQESSGTAEDGSQQQNNGQNQNGGTVPSSGKASDSIVIKSGSSGSISDDGTITINGQVFSKTAQLTAVPKGSIAKVDGTFPLAALYNGPLGTHYQYCEDDSAFPVGRKVKFSSFSIGEYPVTAELYEKVLDCVENFVGSKKPGCRCLLRDAADGTEVCIYYVPSSNFDTEYVCQISYYNAVYFCNALTKLLMSEEDCVYTLSNEKTEVFHADGIAENIKEEYVEEFCEQLNIPRENIVSMFIPEGENTSDRQRYTYTAAVHSNFKKKGFRLPSDAEWEFAARGGNPSSAEWNVEYKESPDVAKGERNALGLADLFYLVSDWYLYNGEFVEDWLTSNAEYALKDKLDSEGYVLNPCFKSNSCTSQRGGTSSRQMRDAESNTSSITKLRLVRTL